MIESTYPKGFFVSGKLYVVQQAYIDMCRSEDGSTVAGYSLARGLAHDKLFRVGSSPSLLYVEVLPEKPMMFVVAEHHVLIFLHEGVLGVCPGEIQAGMKCRRFRRVS